MISYIVWQIYESTDVRGQMFSQLLHRNDIITVISTETETTIITTYAQSALRRPPADRQAPNHRACYGMLELQSNYATPYSTMIIAVQRTQHKTMQVWRRTCEDDAQSVLGAGGGWW